MRIAESLQIDKGITAIIGGGGKTSLMLKLADELKSLGTVIICTTTKIYQPEGIALVASDSESEIRDSVADNGVICVSAGKDDKGKLMPPEISVNTLSEIADFVICEADGSRGLPLKAHADTEPVIPEDSHQTILVMGIDGIGHSINSACHRPEIYSRLACVNQEDIVTPEIAMKVVKNEGYGTRILINKVENDEQMRVAKEMSELVSIPVVAGSIRNGEYECL